MEKNATEHLTGSIRTYHDAFGKDGEMIIPGVQVQVLRELVPPLPSPSGIMGIVGITQTQPARLTPVASFNEFKDVFGAASSYSMPEVRQAFENGIAEMVAAPVGGGTRRRRQRGDGRACGQCECCGRHADGAGQWSVVAANFRHRGVQDRHCRYHHRLR